MRDLRPRGPADWWPASCSRAPPPSRAPTASASLMAIAPLDRGASTREGQALSGQAGSRPHLCARHHPAGPPVVTFLSQVTRTTPDTTKLPRNRFTTSRRSTDVGRISADAKYSTRNEKVRGSIPLGGSAGQRPFSARRRAFVVLIVVGVVERIAGRFRRSAEEFGA